MRRRVRICIASIDSVAAHIEVFALDVSCSSVAAAEASSAIRFGLVVFGRFEASSAADGVCFAAGYMLFPAFVVRQRIFLG